MIAPITLISAILFYFGYVYSTTEYGYFGLDVDTIGLSTQEFIMRSPGPLLAPLLGAGLIAALLVAFVAAAVRRRIEMAAAEAPWRLRPFHRLARICTMIGWAGLGIGAALVFGYAVLGPLVPFYTLVAPSVLAVGAGLAIYAVRLDWLLERPPPSRHRRGALRGADDEPALGDFDACAVHRPMGRNHARAARSETDRASSSTPRSAFSSPHP